MNLKFRPYLTKKYHFLNFKSTRFRVSFNTLTAFTGKCFLDKKKIQYIPTEKIPPLLWPSQFTYLQRSWFDKLESTLMMLLSLFQTFWLIDIWEEDCSQNISNLKFDPHLWVQTTPVSHVLKKLKSTLIFNYFFFSPFEK